MFDVVLVANRGEIACRVIRTLRRLGIRSVAVYSDADAGAPHVRAADVAVRIGPAAAAQSYLSIPAVIDAARATGAQAIHPGYGFLSENTAFAAACEEAGIAFVGPPSSAVEAMGDKIRAKQTVAKAGVPVVPGSDETGLDDAALTLAVEQVGYPVLLKPSAGGGGKGMHEVHRAEDLATAIATARREARNSFGDATLLVERLVTTPRHIEIQVLADQHGNVIHLGERECSLQRRHQKIIEEAPSPLLTPEQREAMGAAAVEAARAVGYTGAGTVEFIVGGEPGVGGEDLEFFFMEMNTRLQVEHPVTEEVYGVDLVEMQLRVAAGERQPWPVLERVGHAVEARIYAEDPAAGFLPTGGLIRALRLPEGVRVDSGVAEGSTVGSDYDPMLAKVIVWAPNREQALRGLDAALGDTVLLGVDTMLLALWDRQGLRAPSSTMKMAWGCYLMTAANLVMAFAAWQCRRPQIELALAVAVFRHHDDRRDLSLSGKHVAVFQSGAPAHRLADDGGEFPAQFPGRRLSAGLAGQLLGEDGQVAVLCDDCR